MNRSTAKAIHEATNITFWGENPEWDPGNTVARFACTALRKLPFSVHELQKRAFFNMDRLIAVNGESVVASCGDMVDKFMFRYSKKMSLETFESAVAEEVSAVTCSLAGIALPTKVGIKPAYVFKNPHSQLPAVAQTQTRLDLATHLPMDLIKVNEDSLVLRRDKTARDIETMLRGSERLAEEFGYYPDVAFSSGNLRRNSVDGTVTLIDVMPLYADGNRLINDHTPGILLTSQENLRAYGEFVGQYGR